MLLKNRQSLLIRKKTKLLETIVGTDEKYRDKMNNALLYLPKRQVEKFAEIDKEWTRKV